MAKEKTPKTNAMRILDRLKISYEVLSYQCDEFIDGINRNLNTDFIGKMLKYVQINKKR